VSRAVQWDPLCETDPTPGEPDEVRRAGRHYKAMADEIDGQVRRLNDIVSGTLRGAYVQSLTKMADGLQEELGRTSGRYREVGGLLEQRWAPGLEGFQDEAERLRQRAVTAASHMYDNRVIPQAGPVDAPPPPDAEVAVAKARQGRYDDASGDLNRLRGHLVDLTERRDSAAAEIADLIRETCDDGVADSGWDNFKDWVGRYEKQLNKVCSVLGYIALAACVVALFIPGLNILAAGALIVGTAATSGSLIIHGMLASTGNGSWWDVGTDAFALATLGAGRFLGPGIKVLGKTFGGSLERLTGKTVAAGAAARGGAARASVQQRIAADVAHTREGLVGGVSKKVGRRVRLDVKATRAQGEVEKNQVFNSARDAYLLQKTVTNPMERVAHGGGDADIAGMRKAGLDAAAGFSETSKVGLAAARSETTYARAVGSMRASNLTTLVSVGTDVFHVKAYDDWRDRFYTKEEGDL
jgi:hypothetical protein